MTCASCVRRIEKSLTKVDGVAGAQVNLATEVATVTYDPQTVALDELIGVVTAAGYGATPKQEMNRRFRPRYADGSERRRDRHGRSRPRAAPHEAPVAGRPDHRASA